MTINLIHTLYLIINLLHEEVNVMTIKEAEEQTGLTRSNIRFYEKEKLIQPSRNDRNGYSDYSEKDIENIKKLLTCVHWRFLLRIFVI